MKKYKVLDEQGKAIRIFHKKSEATKFLQQDWSIQLLTYPSRYEQALAKVGEALL